MTDQHHPVSSTAPAVLADGVGEGMAKRAFGGQIDEKLARQVRDAVAWIQTHVDPAYTLSAFLRESSESYLAELSKRHRNGRKFPKMHGLRPGRPPGDS